MQPFTVETTIARPREEIFRYLADVANHPEFTDHFLVDWHMTREETYGLGAGGRFRAKLPFARFGWGDAAITDIQDPAHIVLSGRWGKYNRIRTLTVFELRAVNAGSTRVALTIETWPALLTDRFLEKLGQGGALRRNWRRALKRLGTILEEDRGRGQRATVAGGARHATTGLRV